MITQHRGKLVYLSDTFEGKKHDQALSEADKQRNREIAKQRAEIEHHLSGIKRCNIVVHPLRNRTDHFADDVMETACSLQTFDGLTAR